jgi:hypothetical protein
MKKEWGIAIFVVGILLAGAEFYPLRREVRIEEKGVREETWWREETELKEVTKTREEEYTEEIKKEEFGEEVLLRKSISVPKSSTSGMHFDLRKGDKIIFRANALSDMIISFYGEEDFFISIEITRSIERTFIIRKDGIYSLLYSPLSIINDIVINFDIVKVGTIIKTEKVQKTRIIEYTEKEPYTTKIPYTTNVPYTIITEKKEKYNIEALRYVGLFLVLAGAFIFWKDRKS